MSWTKNSPLLLAACIVGLALGAWLDSQASYAAPPARTFDPVAFFTGRTEGAGTLKQVMSARQATHVTGSGALRADGWFVLDQTVEISREPTRTRQWRLRQAAPGRFQGTISDAVGPVTATVAGATLNIRYAMDGGMRVEQALTLATDGRSAHNAMKIRKFGFVVATLDETIRRV